MLPAIPLSNLPTDVLDETQRRLLPWARIHGNAVVRCGVAVDPPRLSPSQRWLVDDGQLLPEWAYHWLTLGAELAYIDRHRGLGSVLIFPNTKKTRVVILETTEIAAALGEASFENEAGVILAWGIVPEVMASVSKPHWPLSCQGAVASAVDGLGMVCVAGSSELERVASWVRQP